MGPKNTRGGLAGGAPRDGAGDRFEICLGAKVDGLVIGEERGCEVSPTSDPFCTPCRVPHSPSLLVADLAARLVPLQSGSPKSSLSVLG